MTRVLLVVAVIALTSPPANAGCFLFFCSPDHVRHYHVRHRHHRHANHRAVVVHRTIVINKTIQKTINVHEKTPDPGRPLEKIEPIK